MKYAVAHCDNCPPFEGRQLNQCGVSCIGHLSKCVCHQDKWSFPGSEGMCSDKTFNLAYMSLLGIIAGAHLGNLCKH